MQAAPRRYRDSTTVVAISNDGAEVSTSEHLSLAQQQKRERADELDPFSATLH